MPRLGTLYHFHQRRKGNNKKTWVYFTFKAIMPIALFLFARNLKIFLGMDFCKNFHKLFFSKLPSIMCTLHFLNFYYSYYHIIFQFSSLTVHRHYCISYFCFYSTYRTAHSVMFISDICTKSNGSIRKPKPLEESRIPN